MSAQSTSVFFASFAPSRDLRASAVAGFSGFQSPFSPRLPFFKLPPPGFFGITPAAMSKTILCAGLAAVVFLAALAGCRKSDPPSAETAPALQPSTPVPQPASVPALRLHWLGKKQLEARPDATNFIAIWNLPESAKLQAATLDKLATAPWRLWRSNVAVSNAPVSALRPLLDDLIAHETCLEVAGGTNQPWQAVLAIRLPPDRAALWQSNLPLVLNSLSLTNLNLNPALTRTLNPSLSRVGDWTLLSLSTRTQPDRLLADLADRIQRRQPPFADRATNYWLEADADLPAFAGCIPLSSLFRAPQSALENLPRLALTVIGDGENVRSRGELIFPKPLDLPLDPWNIPTNLVREPLVSFGAIRGLRGLLAGIEIPPWLGLSQWPDQFYSWGRSGPPLQMFAAFPTRNSSNDFLQLSQPVADWIRDHIPATNYGAIAIATNAPLLSWDGLFFGLPSLRAVTNADPDFLLIALASFHPARTNQIPGPLLERLSGETNLLALGWEFTDERLSQWRYFDDASRIILDAAHRARLNRFMAGIEWIVRVKTNLHHSLTELRLSDPARLSFARKSTVGLTALETDVLVNWLELPQFPAGFQTMFATNSEPRVVRRKTAPGNP
jgi:hypothetical protein